MIALWIALRASAADDYAALSEVHLAALGLGPATVVEGSTERRYPLEGGGWVRVLIFADAAAADAGFDGLVRTGATFWPPAAALPGFDRVAGDGRAALLVRVGNAVLFARDPREGSADLVRALVAELTPR